MQVADACEASDSCYNYWIADRADSAARLAAWPLVPNVTAQLGYGSLDAFALDATAGHEPVNLLSEFCLSPPGDYAIRRGFWDALLMGCVPVVFDERSRPWHSVFPHGSPHSVSVLLPAHLLQGDPHALERALRAFRPQLPRMQRTIAQHHAQFQFSVADMGEADHKAIGPDAFDLALVLLAENAKRDRQLALEDNKDEERLVTLTSDEDLAQWRRQRMAERQSH